MHKTLEHQLQKYLRNIDSSKELSEFLNAVNQTYEGYDEDRKLLNRSLELSSKEFVEINERMEQSRNRILSEKNKDEAILESIGDGIIITDKNGKIVLINPSGESMLGHKAEEVLGMDFYMALHFKDDGSNKIVWEKSPLAQALNRKEKVSVMNTLNNKDNELITVGIIITPYILNNDIAGAVIAFRDITKETAVDRAKSEFVSLASHQLRTPLSTIGWYTEAIQSGELGPVNEKQAEYLLEIALANRRMTHLVKSLLNVSRIELGTLMIESEEVDLVQRAEGVFKDLRPRIEEKELTIGKHYDPKLPKAFVDDKLIEMVFQNLLSNATKYTPAKGKVDLTLKVNESNPEFFDIIVKDNGYGIPEAQKGKIFQKLFRADNVREKETDGTGLGMYLVKQIMERVGGTIKFESELNKGTTFFLTIPLRMEKVSGTKKIN